MENYKKGIYLEGVNNVLVNPDRTKIALINCVNDFFNFHNHFKDNIKTVDDVVSAFSSFLEKNQHNYFPHNTITIYDYNYTKD